MAIARHLFIGISPFPVLAMGRTPSTKPVGLAEPLE